MHWKREQYEDGVCCATASVQIAHASIVARGDAHYLTFVDDSQAGQETRTTLRFTNDEVTLIRHGAIRWTHHFKVGQKHASTLYLGASALAVETYTDILQVCVTDSAGQVHLAYQMDLSGQKQEVKLWVHFGNSDPLTPKSYSAI